MRLGGLGRGPGGGCLEHSQRTLHAKLRQSLDGLSEEPQELQDAHTLSQLRGCGITDHAHRHQRSVELRLDELRVLGSPLVMVSHEANGLRPLADLHLQRHHHVHLSVADLDLPDSHDGLGDAFGGAPGDIRVRGDIICEENAEEGINSAGNLHQVTLHSLIVQGITALHRLTGHAHYLRQRGLEAAINLVHDVSVEPSLQEGPTHGVMTLVNQHQRAHFVFQHFGFVVVVELARGAHGNDIAVWLEFLGNGHLLCAREHGNGHAWQNGLHLLCDIVRTRFGVGDDEAFDAFPLALALGSVLTQHHGEVQGGVGLVGNDGDVVASARGPLLQSGQGQGDMDPVGVHPEGGVRGKGSIEGGSRSPLHLHGNLLLICRKAERKR